MSRLDGPISQFFDWTAAGGHSDAEVEKLIARCIDSTSSMSADDLRREVVRWSKDIRAAHGEGNAGRARQLAREAAAVIETAVGDLPPVDTTAGKSMRDVIDSIAR